MSNFSYDGHAFYHGTSRIFLESIRSTGLGAINPNIDFKNLEVLKYLYQKVKDGKIHDPTLSTWEDSIRATIGQTDLIIGDQKFNYRHDGIYVSASHIRASIYACLNKYGSEVLEKCIVLLELLEKHHIPYKIPSEIDVFKVKDYIKMDHLPVMVVVSSVDDNDLEKEDGKRAAEALAFLRHTMPKLPEKQRFEFLQYCNFKLLKPVPPENLKFYEIEFEGHPKNNDFKIYLSKI